MTLIDSLDSILMLYSYSGFPESDSFAIFEKRLALPDSSPAPEQELTAADAAPVEVINEGHDLQTKARELKVKLNMMSGLSIVLTLMSILVAFRYACTVMESTTRTSNHSHAVYPSSRSWV